jgi:hypothetical protein
LGTKLEIWPPTRGRPDMSLFTLTAREMPFWDVFIALSKQRGLSLQDMGNGLRLMSQGGQGWRNGIVNGPVAVFPQSISRTRNSNLQNAPGNELSPETMSLAAVVAIDPRIRIVKYANPYLTEVRDDAGNSLLKVAPPDEPHMWDASRSASVQSFDAPLEIPEHRGAHITSAKGMVQFVAQIAEAHIDITDLEKKTGQTFALAGQSIRLSRFTAEGNPDNLNINFGLDLIRPSMINNTAPDALNATVTLIDATGRTLYTYTVQGSMGASLGGGGYTPPFTLRLSIPTKSKTVKIPFELKDLPLP